MEVAAEVAAVVVVLAAGHESVARVTLSVFVKAGGLPIAHAEADE